MAIPDQPPDSPTPAPPHPPANPPAPLLGYVSDEDLAHSRLFGKLALLLALPVAVFLLWILFRAVLAMGTAFISLFR